MLVGVPKEVKTYEVRGGLVPGSSREPVRRHGRAIVAGSGTGPLAHAAVASDRGLSYTAAEKALE